MIKYFTITKRSAIAFIVSFLLMFVAVSLSHAIESTASSSAETTQKYHISFPIAELGNCGSLSECRKFCDDPVNHDTCINFAKKKGFYRESVKESSNKGTIIDDAKSELGCDSEDSCKSFCGQQQNWQKCGDFARKHHLGGGQTEDPGKAEILAKAKQVLGCNSYEECKNFCSNEANKQKCDEFAKSVHLRGGVEKKGPGGCSSEETCRTYCSDPNNFNECSQYGQQSSGGFRGPGGCDSEVSCKAFCQQHPEACKTIRSYGGPQSPAAYENANERAAFCRQYPEKCANASSSGTLTPEIYCKLNPDKCPRYSPSSTPTSLEYAQKCTYYGCSWTGSSCDCSNRSPAPYPTATTSSGGTNTCVQPAGGCGANYAWDSSRCSCRSYADSCQSKSGCSWTGSTCSCTSSSGTGNTSSPTPYPTAYSPTPYPTTSSETSTSTSSSTIKGITVIRNILEQLLDFFR